MKPDTPNTGSNLPAQETGSLGVEKNPSEKASVQAEISPTPGATSSSTAAKDNSVTDQPTTGTVATSSSAPTDQSASSSSFQQQIAQLPAEETDRIENEWVDKADEIENKTANDPYHEDDAQHELSRAYLKKRFGMDVK